MNISIQFNTDDFIASFNSVIKYQVDTIEKNLNTTAEKILEESKDRTPVDIGTLRDNSDFEVKKEDYALVAWIGYFEFYGVYVHQGTGIFALHGDGRKTPWWWKGTTEKWEGWHHTHGQKPKQFLWDTLTDYIDKIPLLLAEGLT